MIDNRPGGLDRSCSRTLKYDSKDISRKKKRFEAAIISVAGPAVHVNIHLVKNYVVRKIWHIKISPMVCVGEMDEIFLLAVKLAV